MPAPVMLCLPTADRSRAHAFYRDGFGFEAYGGPSDDGPPEPLQFVVNDGLHLMFIPPGGFGRVTGDHEVAEPGTSECLLTLTVESDEAVATAAARAAAAGARVVAEPETKPWGVHLALVADPDGHLWQIAHAAGPS